MSVHLRMLRRSDRVASKLNPKTRRKTPIASTAVVEDPPKKRQKKDSMLGLCARKSCLDVEEAETIEVVIGRWECKTDAGWQPFEKTITQAFERALSHGVNVLPFVRKEIKYVAELQTRAKWCHWPSKMFRGLERPPLLTTHG